MDGFHSLLWSVAQLEATLARLFGQFVPVHSRQVCHLTTRVKCNTLNRQPLMITKSTVFYQQV